LSRRLVYWQLKASESWSASGGRIPFDLDVRDYNLWLEEPNPVILILYDAGLRRAYWLHIQDYFTGHRSRHPRREAKTVRVWVPERQRLSRRTIRHFREEKRRGLPDLRLRVFR